jgi:hypothetical protein
VILCPRKCVRNVKKSNRLKNLQDELKVKMEEIIFAKSVLENEMQTIEAKAKIKAKFLKRKKNGEIYSTCHTMEQHTQT